MSFRDACTFGGSDDEDEDVDEDGECIGGGAEAR